MSRISRQRKAPKFRSLRDATPPERSTGTTSPRPDNLQHAIPLRQEHSQSSSCRPHGEHLGVQAPELSGIEGSWTNSLVPGGFHGSNLVKRRLRSVAVHHDTVQDFRAEAETQNAQMGSRVAEDDERHLR